MQARCTALNLVWAASSLQAWRRYRSALRNPAAAQEQILREYLRANSDTAFGRLHGFSTIRSIEEYQNRVPIGGYDDLEPFVRRIARGEQDVLTRAPIRRLVPSSGSTSAAKLIPYTANLQHEIAEAVDAWIVDLFSHRPSLMAGPAYWSITPAIPSADQGVVPVGFDDDSMYLGVTRATLASAILAVPGEVRRISDVEAFRYATNLHLLRARELRLISVWHPTFLTALFDALASRWTELLDDLACSEWRRSAELRAVSPNDVGSIWPKLRLISCWGDGPARPSAEDLAGRFSHIEVQRKGLIATEAIVSIPFAGRYPLAIRSHFFEFLDPTGHPRLAHQLKDGVDYSVVITTGGGLYRYRLFDRVTVQGWAEATPSLQFVGKEDRVSDRFGEKLSDGFVASVLGSLFAGTSTPRFAMLAPERVPSGIAYTLFVEDETLAPQALADALERELRRNPHYSWCVDLGQLRPSRVVHVRPGAMSAYIDFCVARGQRLGDVKPASLHSDMGWSNVLPC
jgi:GH3 auxin-responsive promoter